MARDLADVIPALAFGTHKLRLKDLEGGGLQTFGNIYFVDSGSGASTNGGVRPDRAMATIDQAVSLAAVNANSGDIVAVLPGHAETVSAINVALDVAGVSILGFGVGRARPVLTFDAAGSTITVSAANVLMAGFQHDSTILDCASAYTIGAGADFNLIGNTFDDTSATLNFLSIVTTGATDNEADRLTILGNNWYGLNATPLAFVSILAAELGLNIQGNDVDSASTADVGHFITLAAKIVNGTRIRHNTLTVVGSTGAAVGIFLTGSGTTSTGDVSYNNVASLDTTSELIATAGTGLKFFENYYTGVADASGKLWPVVDAA